MPYVLATTGVAIVAVLALEKGTGEGNHCGIILLSLTEKVHSRLLVKRLRWKGEPWMRTKDADCVLALERWTMDSTLKNVYVKMVSGNSFISFSVQTLNTKRRAIYGCINEH